MDELLAFAEQIAIDRELRFTIADLLRFRILAKQVVCPVQTRDRLLSELQQAFDIGLGEGMHITLHRKNNSVQEPLLNL